MKTIVLTLSRNFSKTHPSAGKETHFVESILNGNKKTTIRGNYNRWNDIRRKLSAGTHILSLRYWSDKPYRSKQVEFARCTKVSLDRVFITNDHNGFEMSLNGNYCNNWMLQDIIEKEGFKDANNFYDWFPQEEFSGARIEFLKIEKI